MDIYTLETLYRRATVTNSGTIESLGVTMDDIKDDIIDPATDQDSDQEAAGEQPHFMRSQHIGKLYIEQSGKFHE